MREGFRTLGAEGRDWLAGQRLEFERTHSIWSLDLRYLGQSFELTVPASEAVLEDPAGEALRAHFHARYREVYGYADEAADLEVLNLRATAIGVTRKPAVAAPRTGPAVTRPMAAVRAGASSARSRRVRSGGSPGGRAR